tara:strand:- start:327 stop:620 length:294 start_codon:yes stop_codon:yes gene_type:complete
MENKDWLIIWGPIGAKPISYHLIKGPISSGTLRQKLKSLTKKESLKKFYTDCGSDLDPSSGITVAFSSVFRVVIVGCQSWMKTVDKEIFQSEDFNCG